MTSKQELTLGVIPARGGSKGIKDKNIRQVLGKPLIAYSIECGLACPSIDHLIVSTDSQEITQIAEQWGAEVPFLRPAELAQDTSPMLPVLQHAISACEDLYQKRVGMLVLLHPTSPLRNVEDVENCVELFRKGNCDAVISARPAQRSPYFNMVTVEESGYMRLVIPREEEIGRRQDTPSVYDLDTSVWLYSRKTLMEDNNRMPRRSVMYLMPEERSIDIDSELDFRILECLMADSG